MGCFTFWVLASFQWPWSQLHKFILKNLGVSLTWIKCIILTFSGTLRGFYFYLVFFTFDKNVWYDSRGCIWWFDFTKSFDPRCLTGGHVHDVSSKMEGWLHFIMLPVPNTNTLDQMERLRACFTCGKLDKKTKKKQNSKVNCMEVWKH